MSYLPLIEPDDDLLPLLRSATNEQLEPLVEYITAKGEGRITSELDFLDVYKNEYPNHKMYVDEIASEIQTFGGNTIANIFRGGKGVPYKEIVCDVANRLKVNYNPNMEVGDIEIAILWKIVEKAYEKMTEEEKKEFLETLGIKKGKKIPKSLALISTQLAINLSGFAAYRLAVIVANAVAKNLIGRGLSLTLNATLTKSISVLAGPIGWAISILWSIIDLAGPAYRVTIPCVIQIAFIRQQMSIIICKKCGAENHISFKFCSNCGAKL